MSAGPLPHGQSGIELGTRPTKTYLVEHSEHGLFVMEMFDARFGDAMGDVASTVDALICMRHPNLARVHGVGRVDSGLAVTCEYVEGETLADLLRASNGALALEVRLRVLVDVLAGLSAIHAAELAVGTLTPSSIVVGTDGVSRIVGVYRGALGARGVAAIERRVLAPEVDLGHDPGASSDVFSVGVMLWEALGRRTLHDPRNAPPPPVAPDKPWAEPLCALASRALVIDPGKRPTQSEMAAAIRMVARSKLASPKKVADAVMEFASEHVIARRTRLARSSGRIAVAQIVTPFDADTSPRGQRTVPAEDFAPEPPTQRTAAEEVRARMKASPPPLPSPAPERLETGAHPLAEVPPRPVLASGGFGIEPTVPKRRSRLAWVAVGAAAIAAATIGLLVGFRPHEAVSPVVPVVQPGSPGIVSAPPVTSVAAKPPSPIATTTSTTSGPPPPPNPQLKNSGAFPNRKAPLKRPGQYDPTSI